MLSESVTQPSPLILHLHIPKTGGTTFCQSVLPSAFGDQGIFAFDPSEREEKLHELAAMSPDELGRFRVVTGHFLYGLHRRLARDTTYVTLLRNPIALYLSNYYYILTRPFHYAHDDLKSRFLTPDQYLEESSVNNSQAKWIVGDDYGSEQELLEKAKQLLQEEFSVVGITERFDHSVCLFEMVFDLAPIVYTTKNTSPFRPTRDTISPEIVDRIKEANAVDIELYDFASRLLDSHLQQFSKEQLGISLMKKAGAALETGDVYRAFNLAEHAWTLCPEHPEFRNIRTMCLDRVIQKMSADRAL